MSYWNDVHHSLAPKNTPLGPVKNNMFLLLRGDLKICGFSSQPGECFVKAGDVFFREGPEEMNLEVLPGHHWWTKAGQLYGLK